MKEVGNMKRVFVFVLCLLLLCSSAFAEEYAGLDISYLTQEFDRWALSEAQRKSAYEMEAVLYTDAMDERRAVIVSSGDTVYMAAFSEVICESKYLEQMFQATLEGEAKFLQVMASLWFESHVPTLEDGDVYADTLGDLYFETYRDGEIRGVCIASGVDGTFPLLAPSYTATPQPTATPTPTPTPKPTNTPEPTSTPVPDLSAMSAEEAVQGLAEHAQNVSIKLDYVMEIEGLVNVGAIITEMVWDEEMAVERICEYVLDISKYAFANPDIDSLVFYFDTELSDDDGTSSLARVAQVNISRKTAESLDYKQATLCVYRSTREALNLFDDTYIYPALYSGVK